MLSGMHTSECFRDLTITGFTEDLLEILQVQNLRKITDEGKIYNFRIFN